MAGPLGHVAARTAAGSALIAPGTEARAAPAAGALDSGREEPSTRSGTKSVAAGGLTGRAEPVTRAVPEPAGGALAGLAETGAEALTEPVPRPTVARPLAAIGGPAGGSGGGGGVEEEPAGAHRAPGAGGGGGAYASWPSPSGGLAPSPSGVACRSSMNPPDRAPTVRTSDAVPTVPYPRS
ncbi:hypothetical protein Adu01nite_48700 [Paractinoplanes durhamensis]|uniref:Uncharacterized protein n=1 Tax=Paractinoplanes durhamensis TaxID=113563 RepID=A0ABQ3Z170_9ACTN|nr:hypothetical protein Adu01nite_48700 [Actinoplanes durhamensis]